MSSKTLSPVPSQLIKTKPSRKKKKEKELDIYFSVIISRTVHIPIINVGRNIEITLKNILEQQIEGKCIAEGYIKPGSTSIQSYSNGVQDGYSIMFDVIIECRVCNPVEGMIISCIAKNITKAGIRAELLEEPSPLVIFVARDHNYMMKAFSAVEENQEIKIRVIGQRFELNDAYISIIGELVEGSSKIKIKKKISVGDDSPKEDLVISVSE